MINYTVWSFHTMYVLYKLYTSIFIQFVIMSVLAPYQLKIMFQHILLTVESKKPEERSPNERLIFILKL